MNVLASTAPATFIPIVLVAVAAAIYVARQALELAGKAPGAELLRKENEDLSRRNAELEDTTARQTAQIEDLIVKVKVLESEMAELRKRDQAAVLERLVEVEAKADKRHDETEAKADDRHQKTVDVLEKIAMNTSPPVHTTIDK